MPRLPLFIVCHNPKCRAVKQVRDPYQQRTHKYCSRRCAAVVTAPLPRNREANRRGGVKAGATRRARRMAQLAPFTRVQIYRMAFQAGWHAGARSVRRRMEAA